MPYNLDVIKKKLAELSGKKAQDAVTKPKFFKPELGAVDIRFLPYQDESGQPFQEVSFYDNKKMNEYRFVTPSQFGMADPILDLITELRKDSDSNSWEVIRLLLPKVSYYAPILVRGRESEGPLIWELKIGVVKQVYNFLNHQDYEGEDLMHPVTGYDFTLTVSNSDRKWNDRPVKNYDLVPRRKASPILPKAAEREALIQSIPNVQEYFKSRVFNAERLQTMVENFLAAQDEQKTPFDGDNSGILSEDTLDSAFKDLE